MFTLAYCQGKFSETLIAIEYFSQLSSTDDSVVWERRIFIWDNSNSIAASAVCLS